MYAGNVPVEMNALEAGAPNLLKVDIVQRSSVAAKIHLESLMESR